MNVQAYFDKAVAGIIKQGRPSYQPQTNLCLYRGPDNTACAIGQIIPDEVYDPVFDTTKCPDFPDILDRIEVGLSDDWELFRDLQFAHDTHKKSRNFVEGFLADAKKVALANNLEWNFD